MCENDTFTFSHGSKVRSSYLKYMETVDRGVKKMDVNKSALFKTTILHISNRAIGYKAVRHVIWQVIKHRKQIEKAHGHGPLVECFYDLFSSSLRWIHMGGIFQTRSHLKVHRNLSQMHVYTL